MGQKALIVQSPVCVSFEPTSGRRDTHFAEPRPSSGYHAVAGGFDEVGRSLPTLSPLEARDVTHLSPFAMCSYPNVDNPYASLPWGNVASM